MLLVCFFFFSSRRRHTRCSRDWSSDVCSSDLVFANKLTTAANTVFLQATNPLFVVALAPWLLRERVRAIDLAFMGVLALGLALLFVGGQRHFATAPDPLLGNVLAAGGAPAWGFTGTGYPWLGPPGGAGPGPLAGPGAGGELIGFLVCLSGGP